MKRLFVLAVLLLSNSAFAADTSLSNLSAGAAVSATDLFYNVQSGGSGGVKTTAAQVKTFTSASPTLVTPVLGVATGTSIAIGGCTISTNAFCVTGTTALAATTVTTSFTATGLVTLADHATQATNTIIGNATSGTASPTALAIGTCSTAGSALIWTTNTGFGCNTSITAAAVPASGLTGTTLASNVVTSSLTSVGTLAGLTVTGSFTATGLVTNADLANSATTVNGQTCTLGSTCTISTTASSATIGTTTIASGADTRVLFQDGASPTGVIQEDAGLVFVKGTGLLTSTLGRVSGAGSAAAPSFGVGNATTGLYSVSTTGLGLTVNGVVKLDYGITTSATWTVAGPTTFSSTVGLLDTSAAFFVNIGATSSVTLTANRALTLNMENVAHIITLGTTANTGTGIVFQNAATQTVAALDIVDQTVTGGANVTSNNIGTVSSGTTTLDCGTRPLQYLTNGGAFTLAAPANDGSCVVLVTNNGSAGTITFSGFSVGSNTGDAYATTNTNKYSLFVWRVNSVAGYRWAAHQ